MGCYYTTRLAGERLRRCYELAPPAVERYLEAEIAHARGLVDSGARLLELGCGYGRVLRELGPGAELAVGIDLSLESLQLARAYLQGCARTTVAAMDALRLGFPAASFDAVLCLQNGVSAFHVDPRALFEEAVRVARPGGVIAFSSYAGAFWPHRLEWFRRQAAAGLVGEIDEVATGGGRIVCRDGFTATTVGPAELEVLAAGLGGVVTVREVAESSVFCEIRKA